MLFRLSFLVRTLTTILVLAALLAASAGDAERAFREGQKLERMERWRDAFQQYARAAELAPRDPRYVVRREYTRQRAAFVHAHSGVRLMEKKRYADAVRDFEAAAEIDPSNTFVREELERAREAANPERNAPVAAGIASQRPAVDLAVPPPELEPPLALRPRAERRSWDLRGDPRALYLAIGGAYGIQFQFDDSVPSVQVRFRLENADFADAVNVLTAITKTMVSPLAERVAIVAADTPEKRREFERQAAQTLELPELTSPAEIQEIANVVRTLLDLTQVQAITTQKRIALRGPLVKVLAAEKMVRQLAKGLPETYIDVEVLEVHTRRSRELGLFVPLQTSLVKMAPDSARVQTGAAAPLPQVFGRAAPTAGQAITQPLSAFGGGRSTFAITIPGAEFRARLSQSLVRGISAQTVRANDSQPATLLIGSRFPIINATFSPIFFGGSVEQQQQQGTLLQPFPSFTFEDIGIKLKVTPRIHADGDVSMKVEASVRALTGQTFNSVPTISNRETDQVVRVANGQTVMISGIVLKDERRSLVGWPFLAEVPVLGRLFGQRTEESSESEILVLITPHVTREAPGPVEQQQVIAVPSNYVPIAR